MKSMSESGSSRLGRKKQATPDGTRSRQLNSSASSFKATEIKAAAKQEASDLDSKMSRPKSNPRLLKPINNA